MLGWTHEELIICPLFLLINAVIALIVFLFLHKKSLQARRIPLYIITITLIVLEIWKITKNIIEGFSPSVLPFQFCSFFMVWSALLLFKNEKIKNFGSALTMTWSTIIFITMLINPHSIYGDSVNSLFYEHKLTHSFVFHELVVLYFILEVCLHTTDYKKGHVKFMPLAMLVFSTLAITLSFVFNENFCGVLGVPAFPLMDSIRLNFGPYVYAGFLFVFGMFLIPLIYMGLYYLHIYKNKKDLNKKSLLFKTYKRLKRK